MPEVKINLVHPHVKINSLDGYDPVIIKAEFIGTAKCPDCGGIEL
jgi:hypothetical protein